MSDQSQKQDSSLFLTFHLPSPLILFSKCFLQPSLPSQSCCHIPLSDLNSLAKPLVIWPPSASPALPLQDTVVDSVCLLPWRHRMSWSSFSIPCSAVSHGFTHDPSPRGALLPLPSGQCLLTLQFPRWVQFAMQPPRSLPDRFPFTPFAHWTRFRCSAF